MKIQNILFRFSFCGFILLSQIAVAANDGYVCGTEQPCVKEEKILLGEAIFLAGLIGPHFILGNGSLKKDFSFYGSFGIGERDSKKLMLEGKTYWPESNQWLLTTAANAVVFGTRLPVRLDYSIGTGYKVKAQEFLIFIPEFNLAVSDSIDAVESYKVGPQLKATGIYLLNDRNNFFVTGSVSSFPKLLTQLGFGYSHDFSKDHVYMVPESRIGFLIGFEEDPFLHQKTWLFSLAIGL